MDQRQKKHGGHGGHGKFKSHGYGPSNIDRKLECSSDGLTNLASWKEFRINDVTAQYGEMSRVLIKGEYPDVSKPVLSTEKKRLYDNPDTPESVKKLLEIEMREMHSAYYRRIERIDDHKLKLFQHLWSHMSLASQQICKSHQDWSSTDPNKATAELQDPLALMNIITSTHTIGRQSEDKLSNRLKANKIWHELHQDATESPLIFHERVMEVLRSRKLLGCADIPDDEAAREFISKLDPVRFSSLQADLHNASLLGAPRWPKDLTAAMVLAKEYKVISSISRPTGATIYATQTDRSKSDRKFGGSGGSGTGNNSQYGKEKNGKDKKSSGSSAAGMPNSSNGYKKSSNNDSNNKKDFRCHECGEPGHFKKYCPKILAKSNDGDKDDDEDTPKGKVRNVNTAFANLHIDPDSTDAVNMAWNFMTKASPKQTSNIGLDHLLLDNQSGWHIFGNRSFLKNLHVDGAVTMFSGIGGQSPESVRAQEVGDLGSIKSVCYSKGAVTNVLSETALHDEYPDIRVDRDHQKDLYTLTLPNGNNLEFVRVSGHYTLDLSRLGKQLHEIFTFFEI
jgi:hypothetical protein